MTRQVQCGAGHTAHSGGAPCGTGQKEPPDAGDMGRDLDRGIADQRERALTQCHALVSRAACVPQAPQDGPVRVGCDAGRELQTTLACAVQPQDVLGCEHLGLCIAPPPGPASNANSPSGPRQDLRQTCRAGGGQGRAGKGGESEHGGASDLRCCGSGCRRCRPCHLMGEAWLGGQIAQRLAIGGPGCPVDRGRGVR